MSAALKGSGVVLCALLGCSSDRPAVASEAEVRVENGVTIVDNPGPHVADTLAWSFDTTNILRIGMVDGPDEYVIGRLAGMLRLPDDNILIADAISHELRVFDARGEFVRKVGRAGEGPGEYGWLSSIMHYTGDSIVVMDNESSRANVLDPDLQFVRRYHPRLRETRAAPRMTSHRLIGFFGDGKPLVSDFLNVCGPRRAEGFCEDSVAFFRTDDAGETDSNFGRFVYGRQESYRVRPGRSTGWREPHPQAMWAVRGDRFYYADAKRFEIRVFTRDGALERIVRVAAPAARYSKDEVFPTRPRSADPEMEESRRVWLDAQANATLPDTLPSFSDLLVDAAGNIWVREYMPPGRKPQAAPWWFVFDPDGRLRWAVRSPPSAITYFLPYANVRPHIGENYLLTSARDADGVESVVLYPLRKDPATSPGQ